MSSRRSSENLGSGGASKKSVSPGLLAVSWSTCPVCSVRFPNRNLLQKHVDLNCKDVYPFVNNQGQGIFELIQGAEHFGEDGEILFLNQTMAAALGLKTLDWVSVSKVSTGEGENVPIGMRVVCSGSGAFPYKAHLSPRGAFTHPNLSAGHDIISVQLIQYHIPLALGITLRLLPSLQSMKGVSVEGVHEKIGGWLDGKLICLNSTFRLQFLTHRLSLEVISVSVPDQVEVDGFHRVSQETGIHIHQNQMVEEGRDDDNTGLDSVGGLDEEIKELKESILYTLTIRNDKKSKYKGRGFLLTGEHGTGKTLLARALCTSLSLIQVPLEDYGKKGLRKAFQTALGISKPTAILIRNLDSHASMQQDTGGTEMVGFAQELRAEMDGLPGDSLVILLGTARNPDLVDSTLRSAPVFAKEVELPVPSVEGRLDILRKILQPFVHSLQPENLERVANETHGFVGGDLEGLRMSAFRLAGDVPPDMTHFREALKTATPSAMKSIQLEIPHVRWDDIGGLHDLKLQLQQAVEWPLKHPEAFERLGLTPPKGLLLYGPPGCSKTMIAKALATESKVNFLSVKGSDLLSKWVGESEKAVQRLFRKARQVAPAILFFDELDALGSERGGQGGGSNVHERVLAQLLVEMDGIEPLKDVTILAATNRPDLIDKALTRPGRLDRIIYVPLPDAETRREILRIKLRRMPLGEDVSLEFLVQSTEGHSGAEIGGICQEAGLKALESDLSADEVRKEHFMTALASSAPRITSKLLSFYESYAKQNQSS